jgi:hypothetical protein
MHVIQAHSLVPAGRHALMRRVHLVYLQQVESGGSCLVLEGSGRGLLTIYTTVARGDGRVEGASGQ